MRVTRKAIILSAGQGKRLLPLTEQRPKCLLPMGGRTLLEWQIAALAANGIDDVVVVTGFHAHAVEAVIRTRADDGITVRSLHNPFFQVADNIGSCFVARHEMAHGDCVLLNGDTLFHPALFAHARAQAGAPIVVTVDRKDRYDSDDMKVQLDGTRLAAIGKTLPPEQTHAESIGMLFFSGKGARTFTNALDQMIRRDGGLNCWYLAIIDELAPKTAIMAADIHGHAWCEVDFPKDLAAADQLATRLLVESLWESGVSTRLCSQAP